jgi:hypothetical protein
VPRLYEITLAFVLQLRKKHGKTSVRITETSVRLRETSVRVQYSIQYTVIVVMLVVVM